MQQLNTLPEDLATENAEQFRRALSDICPDDFYLTIERARYIIRHAGEYKRAHDSGDHAATFAAENRLLVVVGSLLPETVALSWHNGRVTLSQSRPTVLVPLG